MSFAFLKLGLNINTTTLEVPEHRPKTMDCKLMT